MARLIEDNTPAYVKKSSSRSLSSNRPDQEFKVGMDAKKFLDSFFTTLNDAPSDICTYFKIDSGETTFSSNINNQKLVGQATKFIKIEDFVMWGQKVDKELAEREDDEREVAYTPEDQERIVLQGTIQPAKGDHVILKSQGNLGKPYIVSNVRMQKLIDKPIYLISLSPSPTFTRTSIEKNVTATYKFILGNIGTQKKTLILNTLIEKMDQTAKIMEDLNKMYVDTFYDVKYDILRYVSQGINNAFVSCKAMRYFQNDTGILRYGTDLNTLFVEYPFVTDGDLKDYKVSFINKILKKRLVKYGETPEMLSINPNDNSILFAKDYQIRDLINEENEELLDIDELIDYTPKYDVIFYFYNRIHTEFSMLTNFRNSGLTLLELNSRPDSIGKKYQEDYIKYEPKFSLFRYIIDKYMEDDFTSILNVVDALAEYIPLNNNIDDYLVIPLVLFIYDKALDAIERDDLTVSL